MDDVIFWELKKILDILYVNFPFIPIFQFFEENARPPSGLRAIRNRVRDFVQHFSQLFNILI